MLSILIPVYNFNVVTLVNTIHEQARLCNIDFEIICLDDHSNEDISKANSVINALNNTSYVINTENQGRNKTRLLLCEKATYDWLLFLDADVIPKNNNHISNYLTLLDSDYDAVYGGFAYYDKPPKKPYKLRWQYGRHREEVKADQRNKKPYKVIISANFIIKKAVFKTINEQIVGNYYGEDNQLGALLKSNAVKVFHIDNEVYHLGIEPSDMYLKKKEQAALTLLHLYNSNSSIDHDNDLLALFETIKRYRFAGIFAFSHKIFKGLLRKNLIGNHPSISALQWYRIGFMCFEDKKQKNK